MLSRFFESLYVKVFINIVIEHSKTAVHIEMIDNKNNVINTSEHVFNAAYLSNEMYEYISLATKESPYYYISVLDNSSSQGAIPTCDKSKIGYFRDLSDCEYKCYKNSWTYYTEKSDIYGIEKVFEKTGVDFIFSPFAVLANFFKDKINTHLAMFILAGEKTLSLSVFDNSRLLYAEHLNISNEFEHDDLLMEDHDMDEVDLDDEESIDLDSIDALDDMESLDDMDEFDDFGDIADLDAIEEIDEFSEAKDIEEQLFEDAKDKFSEASGDSFNDDYQRFLLIQSSISQFYEDGRYESEFIENVYIADNVGLTMDFKKFLEEEMFLNVYIRHIDLGAEVCDMAKMELS